jgi:L-fuconolactonase
VIVDSHIHLWGESVASAEWLAGPANDNIRRSFSLADYERASDGLAIESAVVVTAEQSVAESARLLAECAGSPAILGVVGWVDLAHPDARPLDGLVGIRHSVISEAAGWLDRREVRAGIARFAAAGLVLELLVAARDLDAVTRCADAHPELPIVVDHLGDPPADAAGWERWEASIRSLADRPNSRVKVSEFRASARSVDTALDAFGPGRVMFGSNWPVCLSFADIARELAELGALTDRLSPSERDRVLRSTALETYGATR